MRNASFGFVLVAGLSLVAASGTSAAQDNQQTKSGQPVATGTMYDGNNTQPPKLTLQGPLAPITEALESSASFAPRQGSGGATSQGANAGGNSGNARAGGGG